ncbi:ABC transporter ATP-binding protein [uncultured Holdemanella sp.]|uniref:ABC transporter ATP-binding protein n=1 Tax=uncultured Holdemanella sp. TaxID=1763549 RepID=UPI00265AC498|nr:ABC transporter ATP-binding protein [uncultured Holdemanella sp.]
MKTCIEFNGVSKKYELGEKAFYALDDVSFSIDQHEMVVILGPSGAGKSTLLNIMGGMDHVTDGKVYMDGLDISGYSEKELTDYRAENIGFIFQFYNILPTLTVKENVDLIRDVVKNAKDSTEILNKVGLNGQENKFPNQLSGGEQQRVSIARAIAKNPKLLLCDEPTGALDSNTGVEILKLLQECTKENTVVIVTHNALIADVADRVIRLKNGKIIENVVNAQPKNIDEVNW